jgi:hypothetical protein
VVTIDDVLDYLLPDDWRSQDGNDDVRRRAAVRNQLMTGSIPLPGGKGSSHGTS